MIEETTSRFGALLDAHTIRFERELPGPIERVWAYLTESDLKATWIAPGDVPSEIGGERTTTWEGEDGAPGGGLTFRTRVFDPPHVLEYDWIELSAPGGAIRDSIVRFELAANGDRVRLTLTHRALPTESYTTITAGWHAHLDTLVAQLDGSGGPDAFARYGELEPLYGALGSFPAAGTVRLERALAAPPERVWAYLTESDLLAGWLGRGAIASKAGATSTLALLANDDTIEATVQTYDPPRALAYTWFSTQHETRRPDPSVVRFELTPQDEGTLLVLTHTGVLPAFRGRAGAGWHALLDALAARLRGHEAPAFFDVYNRVIDGYESAVAEA
ncbi:MAG TPA: SRPBCC family protein [Candidatus Elarobacter sp.]|jgi:uncharacterized protein YndB with AHSA1/START domain|nr:SRPBCC family protein [Candidatus Elarobacter sp.]